MAGVGPTLVQTPQKVRGARERLVHFPRPRAAGQRRSTGKLQDGDPTAVAQLEPWIGIHVGLDETHAVPAGRSLGQSSKREAQGTGVASVENGARPAAHSTLRLYRRRCPKRSTKIPVPAPTASVTTSVMSASRFGTNNR